MMRYALLLSLAWSQQSNKFPKPLGFADQSDFDFPLTKAEKIAGWNLSARCGQRANVGSTKDQRNDMNCPNVLLINSDDMAWGDLSINNPSKMVPTPNLDRLVSKGINFRDGHSCTARCAPSRYCLMTGRYHFRRGDYHYKPMMLEYGRKILTHLFKRNNYYTMVVGKPQPVEERLDKQKHYFVEGTRFWGYDRSFTSRSYCCLPGGGYFENDQPTQPFNRYAIFTEFRDEDESALFVNDDDEERFYNSLHNFHFLDGFTEDGNPDSRPRKNTYIAYWTAIKNGFASGLNGRRLRRRRDSEGKRIQRDDGRSKRSDQGLRLIREVVQPGNRVRQNYVRFMDKTTAKVIVANFKLKGLRPTKHKSERAALLKDFNNLFANWTEEEESAGPGQDRVHYEFSVQGELDENGRRIVTNFATKKGAETARQKMIAAWERKHGRDQIWRDMSDSRPKLTQRNYDSRYVMETFHDKAIRYIKEHVQARNPIMRANQVRQPDKNKPFYMYMSFRAPHRPNSHSLDIDEDNPEEHMPYLSLGKPAEQLKQFDQFIGNIMRELHRLNVADNTLVFFTSDNGPDQGAFNLFNRFGHLRMTTMRGKKASVYEGGHRVPFLSWWPLGIHQSLHGTNFDLPVGQVDLFATFADVLNYPLPSGDECIYAKSSKTDSTIGRPALKKWTTGGKKRPKHHTESITQYKNRMSTSQRFTYGYDTKVPFRFNGDMSDYLMESQFQGWGTVETWKTEEEQTGFIVGWEGCMAEDSQSFAAAFKAKKVGEYINERGKKVHQFVNSLNKVPSKIFAGKLGDLSIRFGRYKLVRFNAPKDLRTGPTRQHLVNHYGTQYMNSDERFRCTYFDDGRKTQKRCRIDADCREHTTWGQTFCVRDHYYQLWDLERNFGEKTLCRDTGSNAMNTNMQLENGLFGSAQPRNLLDEDDYEDYEDNFDPATSVIRGFNVGSDTVKGEKPTDKNGYGTGVESSPVGSWVNDCCVLNLDEKFSRNPKHNWVIGIDTGSNYKVEPVQGDKPVGTTKRTTTRTTQSTTTLAEELAANRLPCGERRYQRNGREVDGGKCVLNRMYLKKVGNSNDPTMWKKFFDNEQKKWLFSRAKNYSEKFGWTAEKYFNWPTSLDDWQPGFICRNSIIGDPKHAAKDKNRIWDGGEWRHVTVADRFCNPTDIRSALYIEDDELERAGKFNLGCKVPEHNGPLAEGWEANPKFHTDKDKSRVKVLKGKPLPMGQLHPADFKEWLPFTECLRDAMQLIEGQAYYPEAKITKKIGTVGYTATVFTDLPPFEDNGTEEGVQMNDVPLTGRKIGASNMARARANALYAQMKETGERREFHGAGSRYNEKADGSDSVVSKCFKKLPLTIRRDVTRHPAAIKPRFDLEMDLLGWYDTNDGTGGSTNGKAVPDEFGGVHELTVGPGGRYINERPVQKYYVKQNNGRYLKGFEPQY